MMTLCHNCRTAVPESSAYCPECGAPQLRVQSAEARLAEQAASEQNPPQRHAGSIAWPTALRSAAIAGVPTGIALSFLSEPSLLDMICVAAASLWTLRRYRRVALRAPVLTPQLGGRIGLVVALIVIAASKGIEALRFAIERYILHHGAAIDAQLQGYVQPEIQIIKASNPDAAAQLAVLSQFWASAEGRACMLLFFVATSAAWMLFAGWLSGRFAVRLPRQRPRRP